MRGAGNDVNDILVLRQDLWERLDHILNSLVRREQAEREQHCFPFHTKAVLVEIGIQEWQIGNTMWNHVDFVSRHFEDFLQKLR